MNNMIPCPIGRNGKYCVYNQHGYTPNTCPLVNPIGAYRVTPFTNNIWEFYTQQQYMPYVNSGSVRYFANDIQRALLIYNYASQALTDIENLRKDAEEMRMLLQGQRENQIILINNYAQRNRNIIPNRSFGLHLTNEQLKFIWQFGSELLSDHIKESIKATDTYKSSGELAQKAQLFAVDVGKEVVDKIVEDAIDNR